MFVRSAFVWRSACLSSVEHGPVFIVIPHCQHTGVVDSSDNCLKMYTLIVIVAGADALNRDTERKLTCCVRGNMGPEIHFEAALFNFISHCNKAPP